MPEAGQSEEGIQEPAWRCLQDTVKSGQTREEMAGGREKCREATQRKGCRGDRVGREDGASWVLWLKTGIPLARTTSTQWG